MSSTWHCFGCGTALSQAGYSYCNVCKQTNVLTSLQNNNKTQPNPIVDVIGNFVGGFISTIFYIFLFLVVLSVVINFLDK